MTETYYGGKFAQWFDFVEGVVNHHHIKWFNPSVDYYNTLFLDKIKELKEKIKPTDLLIIDSEYFQPNYTQQTIIELSKMISCDVIVIHKDAGSLESYKNITVQKPMYNLNKDSDEEIQRRFNYYILNYGKNDVIDISYQVYKIFHNNLKLKKFLCTNGCKKPHRTVLYHLLKKHDVLKNTFFSYSLHVEDGDTIEDVFGKDVFDISEDEKDFPILLDFDYTSPNQDPNSHFTPLTLSSNCIFEIVSATQYKETYEIFTSEKIFRPFIGFLFPIYVGQYRICELLRKMGFDLFDDIIDHSYDLIENPTDRMICVTNEIKRLNDISFQELNKIRTDVEIKKRLERNLNILKDLANTQIEWLFNFDKYKSVL